MGVLMFVAWAVGFALGCVAMYLADLWVDHYVWKRRLNKPMSCPHGHVDWDECPVCCH
jgi:hypothetical protein